MKYDSEYYIARDVGPASRYILSTAANTGVEDFLLESDHCIANEVKGTGKIQVNRGDKVHFHPHDYHELPEPIVSERLKTLIQQFTPIKVDFYPTEIISGKQVWKGHYFLHIYNEIAGLHPTRSIFDFNETNDEIFIEKLSLNEELLDKIPLQQRLIFVLEEDVIQLYHESVVETISNADITGIKFGRVDKWQIGQHLDSDN
ncbi:imm11 family protein [Spartinivicinus ruber]|uniref:imm11 family protein n=1 Tax=Spartinivicinus ruber TaxID=2683272 RepID=UPI0013D4D964|nr:DUF1629 domain-containing protein [Spartinivicinus ruber]